jgi:hypothetical protein
MLLRWSAYRQAQPPHYAEIEKNERGFVVWARPGGHPDGHIDQAGRLEPARLATEQHAGSCRFSPASAANVQVAPSVDDEGVTLVPVRKRSRARCREPEQTEHEHAAHPPDAFRSSRASRRS